LKEASRLIGGGSADESTTPVANDMRASDLWLLVTSFVDPLQMQTTDTSNFFRTETELAKDEVSDQRKTSQCFDTLARLGS
jgi:hypothetical protein